MILENIQLLIYQTEDLRSFGKGLRSSVAIPSLSRVKSKIKEVATKENIRKTYDFVKDHKDKLPEVASHAVGKTISSLVLPPGAIPIAKALETTEKIRSYTNTNRKTFYGGIVDKVKHAKHIYNNDVVSHVAGHVAGKVATHVAKDELLDYKVPFTTDVSAYKKYMGDPNKKLGMVKSFRAGLNHNQLENIIYNYRNYRLLHEN